jgi:hypothetical protein
VNFSRDTYADAGASPRNRKRARGKIWGVSDLPGNFQDALARDVLDASSPVQRPINRANRYVRNLCN